MCFQIVNVEKPNSAQNTIVFCCFLAPDSYVNLSLTLSRFDEQVKALNSEAMERQDNSCFPVW